MNLPRWPAPTPATTPRLAAAEQDVSDHARTPAAVSRIHKPLPLMWSRASRLRRTSDCSRSPSSGIMAPQGERRSSHEGPFLPFPATRCRTSGEPCVPSATARSRKCRPHRCVRPRSARTGTRRGFHIARSAAMKQAECVVDRERSSGSRRRSRYRRRNQLRPSS